MITMMLGRGSSFCRSGAANKVTFKNRNKTVAKGYNIRLGLQIEEETELSTTYHKCREW